MELLAHIPQSDKKKEDGKTSDDAPPPVQKINGDELSDSDLDAMIGV